MFPAPSEEPRNRQRPQLAKLEERVPAGLANLMELPGLSAKRASLLYHKLGIESLADLEHAVRSGALEGLPGFGGKTLKRIRDALARRSDDAR